MPRYLLELTYDGKPYHGFQKQPNAHTVEEAVENALSTYLREEVDISGSSRTDTGVHALHNTAHFDVNLDMNEKDLYHLNAILPAAIAISALSPVGDDFHARFDAKYRKYLYRIHTFKNPIISPYSYYYPYRLDTEKLDQCAKLIMDYHDFSSFSKKNTDVHHYECEVEVSQWESNGNTLAYHVKANRFLRGMVRGLVATQLKVARGAMSLREFQKLLEKPQISTANFASPAHGLYLEKVGY